MTNMYNNNIIVFLTHTHTYIHTRTHTYIHTHIRTYTYTHVHTRTHTPQQKMEMLKYITNVTDAEHKKARAAQRVSLLTTVHHPGVYVYVCVNICMYVHECICVYVCIYVWHCM